MTQNTVRQTVPTSTPDPIHPPHVAGIRRTLPVDSIASIDDGAELTISEVCELLGITAHTARYYERAGLIEVARSPAGRRTYDRKAVERLFFLVRMRTSGMGMSELSRYVDLVRAGESTTPQRL